MTPERWQRVEALYEEALQRAPAERSSFLDEACGDDSVLREEVHNLLAEHEADPDFLGEPLIIGQEDPEEIGPYRLERLIGQGGMGRVYVAVRDDGEFRQRVAIKIIRRGFDTDEILQRFRVERQILAGLHHPHVARLLDGGTTEEGLPYFVMEYIEGEPITTYCDNHRLSIDERLKLFQQVCLTVQYAHQSLIVHRDLKPSNILIKADGTPKLLDFGIAKLLDPAQAHLSVAVTQTGMRVMTPEYASPEQVRGEAVTTATDVYALGVLLYELLTGSRPYRLASRVQRELERVICEEEPLKPSTAVTEAATEVESASQGDDGDPLTPVLAAELRGTEADRLRRRLSGDLDNIVLMAMRKEPSRRYTSAEQLAEDLHRHLRGMPVIAQPDSLRYRTRKFVQRHRFGVVALSSILVLLIVSTVSLALQSERIRAKAAEVSRERDRAEQVVDFLVGLFEASDPSKAGGETVTARALLESGTASVERELEHQPEVQATMMAVLGRVYTSLGLYDRAEELARRALRLRRELYSDEHVEIARSLNDLGLIMDQVSRYEEADSLFRAALVMRENLLGTDDLDVAESLQHLGWLSLKMGRYGEADSLYRRALAIRRSHRGEEHPDVAETLNDLGILYRRQGWYDDAEQTHREALAIRRAAFGDRHRWVGQSLNNWAIVMENQGDHAAAESLLTQAVAVWAHVLGEQHPDVVLAQSNLAKQHFHQGNYETADSLFRHVLEMQRERLGERHRNVALTLTDLGQIRHRWGRLVEAESYYRRALEIRRGLFGDTHQEIGWSLENLAAIEKDQGRFGEAERLYREALDIYRSALRHDHPEISGPLIGMGDLMMERGNPHEAEGWLRDAYHLRRKAYGDDHRSTAQAALSLAGCLTELGRADEARPLFEASLPVLQRNYGDAHPLTMEAKMALQSP